MGTIFWFSYPCSSFTVVVPFLTNHAGLFAFTVVVPFLTNHVQM